jgi:hypothetical protein
MTVPTGVDRDAPVIAVHEIDIAAALERVWRLHVEVDAWPRWQTEITAAHSEGALERGASFDWTSMGSVSRRLSTTSPSQRVLWGGTAGGITGVHEWLFNETPEGVHVRTTESFAGEPVEADAAGMQPLLDASLVAWLAHLKAAVESPA